MLDGKVWLAFILKDFVEVSEYYQFILEDFVEVSKDHQLLQSLTALKRMDVTLRV